MARPGIATRSLRALSAHCRYGLHVSAQRATVGGRGCPPLDPPEYPRCAVVGGPAHRRDRDRHRVCNRRRIRHKELTSVFAGLYIAGCVAAVLAVRQDGLFTAVIQPPLILFCAVPGAYWLFHGGKVGNLKDLLINCGYPLIERFPLMLGTAGGVLLIGLIRWYLGMSHRTAAAPSSAPTKADGTDRRGAKSVLHRRHRREAELAAAHRLRRRGRRRGSPAPRSGRSSARTPGGRARPAGGARERSAAVRPSRSRQSRPPLDDQPTRRPGERRRADARRRPRLRPCRPAAPVAAPPRPQAIPTRAASRRGKSAATRALPHPYERSGAAQQPLRRLRPVRDLPGAPERPIDMDPTSRYEPAVEPRRRRAHRTGPTAPTRRTTRSRRSATAGQAPDEPGEPERRGRSRAWPAAPTAAESWDYDV